MKKGVVIAILVPILLSLPFYGLQWNKLMHLFGVVLFMGNILVTAVWFSVAKRSAEAQVLRVATRTVVLTDRIFTTPGVILLLLNGGIMGTPWFKAGLFKTGASWLMLSLVLFVIWVLIWTVVLIPLQRRMLATAQANPIPEEINGLIARWFRFGGIATLLPLASLPIMVMRPAVW